MRTFILPPTLFFYNAKMRRKAPKNRPETDIRTVFDSVKQQRFRVRRTIFSLSQDHAGPCFRLLTAFRLKEDRSSAVFAFVSFLFS